ncbi:hypothetical protein ZOSMA_630G00020 [Zostera marina]|uniref:Uncharacterized protein n=1 Tax=Zostera marina TaxID=29655 RepID=A0A0K9NVE9_ZOSMR|nr:hypothetical protein ZOSMA_630G00020 [Zostera marina]
MVHHVSCRILSRFKLNPFEHLNLSYTSTRSFWSIGKLKAQQLLLDPQEREYLLNQIKSAKGEIRIFSLRLFFPI